MFLCDMELFLSCIACQLDNFHSVKERSIYCFCCICGRDEKHFAQIERYFDIMVTESIVLLTVEDFKKILTEPHASITEQYTALMRTEGVELRFTDDALQSIAEAAFKVNESTENIGARRLQTIMERLVDEISFDAPERKGETVTIDSGYVRDHLTRL